MTKVKLNKHVNGMTLVIKMCFDQSNELTTICMKQSSFVVVYMTQAQ